MHPQHTPSPLPSPASASSSTLITTPLPSGQFKGSLGLKMASPLPHLVNIRPVPSLNASSNQTRMSGKGFIEPHHSNMPRRTRKRVVLSEAEREDKKEEEERKEKEEQERKELEVQLSRLASLQTNTPLDTVEQPMTPYDTPNPNHTRMPLHLLSLHLPPSPSPTPSRPVSHPFPSMSSFPFTQIPNTATDPAPGSATHNNPTNTDSKGLNTPSKTPTAKGHLTPHATTLPRRHHRTVPSNATGNHNDVTRPRSRSRSRPAKESPTPISRLAFVRFPSDSRTRDHFNFDEGVESSQSPRRTRRPASIRRESSLSAARDSWEDNEEDEEDDGESEKDWMKEAEERRVKDAERQRRRERRERMCIQMVGREGSLELAFFPDDEDRVLGLVREDGQATQSDEVKEIYETRPFVLLRAIDSASSSSDSDSESETDSERKDGQLAACIGASSQSTASSGAEWSTTSSRSVSQTETSTVDEEGASSGPSLFILSASPPRQEAKATEVASEPKELRLYLPSDCKAYLDGTTSLSAEQVREACAFIEQALARDPTRNPDDLIYKSRPKNLSRRTTPMPPRPRRIRITAPRSRPEEAMSIALCYQAAASATPSPSMSAFSSVPLNSSVSTPEKCGNYTAAGAARLIPGIISEAKQARRRSIPVPGPMLVQERNSTAVAEVDVDIEDDGDTLLPPPSISPSCTPLPPSTPSSSSSASLSSMSLSSALLMLPMWIEIDDADAYSAIHLLVMHLLDEGEWLACGKQWDERAESVGLGGLVHKKAATVAAASTHRAEGVFSRSRRNTRHRGLGHGADEDEVYGEDGELEGGDEEGSMDDDEEESTADDDEENGSAGARLGSHSGSEVQAQNPHHDERQPDTNDVDDGSGEERGRTQDRRVRGVGAHKGRWHGVPMASKYEEPSSAFISSSKGKSKSKSNSRARSQSKSNTNILRDSRQEEEDNLLQQQQKEHRRALSKAAEKRRKRRELRKHQRAGDAQYKGIRTEWRGVLSFDGLDRLVGMWAPGSA